MITTTCRLQTTDHRPRTAFTLVELLVVIAIIAILFSLTSAAVIKVIGVADETANRTNIGHLEVAVEAFKEHFHVKYVPSRIWLDETMQYTTVPAGQPASLATDSRGYLAAVWPRLRFGAGAPAIDWNGDGTAGNSSEVLEGDQCLVFFLGGIPAQTGVSTTGFSTKKDNPAYHVASGGDVIQPFFEFRGSRLVKLRSSSRYYSYLDYFGRADGSGGLIKGKPYAYLSSNKAGNDYNRYGSSDCPTLGVAPYFEPAGASTGNIYYNRNGFQIISAGVDGQFGPGGNWSPAGASGIAAQGRDDQANFYDRKLGTSQ